MEISKTAILDKTHYGLRIYSHVLRHYYPGETVLSLSGRDCQPTKNPFNDNKPTLKIQIVNNCAEHYDLENSISKGDAFDFAALHYQLQGDELCQKLNEELYLRIGKQQGFYSENIIAPVAPQPQPVRVPIPAFGYFKAPVTNTVPFKEINLLQVYHLLQGNQFAQCNQLT